MFVAKEIVMKIGNSACNLRCDVTIKNTKECVLSFPFYLVRKGLLTFHMNDNFRGICNSFLFQRIVYMEAGIRLLNKLLILKVK